MSKGKQVPVKEGYGQDSGGLSKTRTYERREQDGQNRLGPADVLNDRKRVMDNE